jgi:hypothetical protein
MRLARWAGARLQVEKYPVIADHYAIYEARWDQSIYEHPAFARSSMARGEGGTWQRWGLRGASARGPSPEENGVVISHESRWGRHTQWVYSGHVAGR